MFLSNRRSVGFVVPLIVGSRQIENRGDDWIIDEPHTRLPPTAVSIKPLDRTLHAKPVVSTAWRGRLAAKFGGTLGKIIKGRVVARPPPAAHPCRRIGGERGTGQGLQHFLLEKRKLWYCPFCHERPGSTVYMPPARATPLSARAGAFSTVDQLMGGQGENFYFLSS
jgi:hypothetical protein